MTAFSVSAAKEQTVKLGFDNFAVRSMQWNARQLVDHAAKQCDLAYYRLWSL